MEHSLQGNNTGTRTHVSIHRATVPPETPPSSRGPGVKQPGWVAAGRAHGRGRAGSGREGFQMMLRGPRRRPGFLLLDARCRLLWDQPWVGEGAGGGEKGGTGRSEAHGTLLAPTLQAGLSSSPGPLENRTS